MTMAHTELSCVSSVTAWPCYMMPSGCLQQRTSLAFQVFINEIPRECAFRSRSRTVRFVSSVNVVQTFSHGSCTCLRIMATGLHGLIFQIQDRLNNASYTGPLSTRVLALLKRHRPSSFIIHDGCAFHPVWDFPKQRSPLYNPNTIAPVL